MMDLTQDFPRSPYEKLNGMVHLPRMADKARAKGAGLLGEYIYPCPLDQMLLAFMGMEPEVFFESAQQKDDQEMAAWVQKKAVHHTSEEIEEWNRAFLNRGPLGEEQEKRFLNSRTQHQIETLPHGWI